MNVSIKITYEPNDKLEDLEPIIAKIKAFIDANPDLTVKVVFS